LEWELLILGITTSSVYKSEFSETFYDK
jgi:hypothetical protein